MDHVVCPSCKAAFDKDSEELQTTGPMPRRFCHSCERSGKKKAFTNEESRMRMEKRRVDSPEKVMLCQSRKRAKSKGLEFDIDESDIKIPDLCPVLDIPIFKGKSLQCPNSPSLDRIDSRLGYVKGNVVVISWKANNIKGDSTLAEIDSVIRWMEKAIANLPDQQPESQQAA
jgi:hypothetical protein